jgi:hypothetical protein
MGHFAMYGTEMDTLKQIKSFSLYKRIMDEDKGGCHTIADKSLSG